MSSNISPEQKAELFDQLIATTPDDIVWMFSSDWDELIFLSGGYEELWGRPRETLETDPQDFLNAVHSDDRDAVTDAMGTVSQGDATEIEFRVIVDEEPMRWFRAHGESIRDDTGETYRVAGFVRDITTQKKREQQLQRQNERLEKFAGVVSHDLRNPLNVAQGRLALAREEYDSEHLEKAASAVDRSLMLVEDLLTLAQQGDYLGDVDVSISRPRYSGAGRTSRRKMQLSSSKPSGRFVRTRANSNNCWKTCSGTRSNTAVTR